MVLSAEYTQSAKMLSERDVERLLTENTSDVRIDVISKIAETHLQRQYSLHEIAIAEQIMRVLVKDTQVNVREALANRLKDNPYIPNDIIIALSSDIDSVALSIIEDSPLLSDSDLINLISSCKSVTKQAAVASRKSVSKQISIALAETRNAQVVSKLVKNKNADIPAEAYQTMIRELGQDKALMKVISQRPNLPATIIEKVISLVSDTLATNIQTKYDIAPELVVGETEKNREVATLMLVDGGVEKPEIEKLVDQLKSFGRLSPSIILTSLCRGNLYFFETSLARLSNVPVQNAQLLIHDKGGLGFKALYTKAGLPDKFFTACKILLEVVSGIRRNKKNISGAAFANEVIHNLLEATAGKNIDNLSYIIALIRQSS